MPLAAAAVESVLVEAEEREPTQEFSPPRTVLLRSLCDREQEDPFFPFHFSSSSSSSSSSSFSSCSSSSFLHSGRKGPFSHSPEWGERKPSIFAFRAWAEERERGESIVLLPLLLSPFLPRALSALPLPPSYIHLSSSPSPGTKRRITPRLAAAAAVTSSSSSHLAFSPPITHALSLPIPPKGSTSLFFRTPRCCCCCCRWKGGMEREEEEGGRRALLGGDKW